MANQRSANPGNRRVANPGIARWPRRPVGPGFSAVLVPPQGGSPKALPCARISAGFRGFLGRSFGPREPETLVSAICGHTELRLVGDHAGKVALRILPRDFICDNGPTDEQCHKQALAAMFRSLMGVVGLAGCRDGEGGERGLLAVHRSGRLVRLFFVPGVGKHFVWHFRAGSVELRSGHGISDFHRTDGYPRSAVCDVRNACIPICAHPPATAWLILAGLGMVGGVALRRRRMA